MSRLLRALDRHWFEPASLRDLAIVRIVLAAATWYYVVPGDFVHIRILADASDALWEPLPALKVLLLPLGWGTRPPFELIAGLVLIAHGAAFLALIGLFSRIATGVLAYSVTVVVTYIYSYGELHHPQTLVVIMLGVLTLSPIGARLSVDALWRRWRQARSRGTFVPRDPAEDLSMHARWPLRLGQWLLVLAYLSAAASKLDNGGLAWMNGTTLAYYLAYDGLMWDRPLGVFLAQQGWLMVALSVFTMIFEATFAAAILFPVLTWLYVAAGVGLHVGIYLAQRAPFFTFLALYIVFLPQLREGAKRIRSRLGGRGGGGAEGGPADAASGATGRAATGGDRSGERPRTAIIYDGLCPLCIRTMAAVDELDGGRRLEYVDLEADWERVRERAPGLTPEDALTAMHVVSRDGRVLRGFDGFRAVAGVVPALRPLALLLWVPPVPPIGRGVYGWVARRRPRRHCRDECAT